MILFWAVSRTLKQYLSLAGNGRYSMALKEHGYSQITATDPSEENVQRLRVAGIDAYVANIYSEVTEKEQI